MTALLVLALALSSCAGDEPTDPPDATTSPVEPTAAPPSDPSPDPTPSATADDGPQELAGEPFDGPPLNGVPARLAVVGVAADDVLNIRAGPGVDNDVIATLAPLATDVAATGAARLLPGSIWLEVQPDGTTGWANSSFFAFLGGTDDITSQLLDDLDTRPEATTMDELGIEVATLVASDDPASTIVISDGPDVGDLGEVTVDVVGLGDDAVRGLRLVVFATVDGDMFTLRTVEATSLCARGPGGDAGCP